MATGRVTAGRPANRRRGAAGSASHWLRGGTSPLLGGGVGLTSVVGGARRFPSRACGAGERLGAVARTGELSAAAGVVIPLPEECDNRGAVPPVSMLASPRGPAEAGACSGERGARHPGRCRSSGEKGRCRGSGRCDRQNKAAPPSQCPRRLLTATHPLRQLFSILRVFRLKYDVVFCIYSSK